MRVSNRRRIAWLIGLTVLSACRCGPLGPDTLVASRGRLQCLPALHFGNVPVGQLARLALVAHNVGAAPLDIASQTVTGDASGSFSEPLALKNLLDPRASSTAALQFRATQAGAFRATLDIASDGDPASTQVALDGTGVDVDVSADPTAIDFGSVQMEADPAPTRSVIFTNAGGMASMRIDASGMLPQFAIADSAGPLPSQFEHALAADGGTYSIQVSFVPSSVQNFSSSLSFVACAGNALCVAPRAIALEGAGVDAQLAVTPNPIAFDGVAPNTASTQTVSVRNLGANAIEVDCVYLRSLGPAQCGAASPLFGIGKPSVALPAVLGAAGSASDSLSLPLTYTASGGTADADELDVNGIPLDSKRVETATAPLLGDQSLGPCRLAVVPSQLGFGTVRITAPVVKTVKFSNLGQSNCALTHLAVDPTSSPAFALSANQAATVSIPAGGAATVPVLFRLGSAGRQTKVLGRLDFQSNDPAQPTGSVPLVAYLDLKNPYAGPWPKWHCDNANSGQTAADTSANDGRVLWKYAGLTSAVSRNASGESSATCGGEAYVNSPVIVGDSSSSGSSRAYFVAQLGMDGTLRALSADGGLLWSKKLSTPAKDPHPSTPAGTKDGHLWVVSGSEDQSKQLYYLSASGALEYSAAYGEDGFDATPGLGADGTLYEADDDGKRNGADPYSALAFAASASGGVNLIAGVSLPLSAESERFGIAIDDDDVSYWGNNGQFFALSSPANGFTPLRAWPGGGVTVADNSNDPNAVGPVFSDLALDPINTGFVYAYSSWEDSTPTNCAPLIGCQAGPPYSVAGKLTALKMADGSAQWSLGLPASQLPAGWAPLCSDYGNAAPAVATDGTVYVGNGDGLRSVAGASGRLNWLFPSANVSGSPAIGGDGTIFFGCSDGAFYAVNPDGTSRFSLNLGAPVSSSPAIASDGTVIVTSDDGTVWAIH